MIINLIAAVSDNLVIGKDGQIPWKVPGDLKRFKKITMGFPIVMGRKTFESIGKPLPGRENIVLTKKKDCHIEGVRVCHSVKDVFPMCSFLMASQIFIIGGEKIYEAFLPFADKLHLTLVHRNYEGDAFFPYFDDSDFKEIERIKGEGEPEHSYVTLERNIANEARIHCNACGRPMTAFDKQDKLCCRCTKHIMEK